MLEYSFFRVVVAEAWGSWRWKRGHTLGRPPNHIDSLAVLRQGCEVLDFAVFPMDLDLPQLERRSAWW